MFMLFLSKKENVNALFLGSGTYLRQIIFFAVYPSIRFTSTISVDMHIENVTQESRKYIHETPKFLCRVNDATDDYAYDINFYINNVLITGALYTNVSKTNIETAVLLQKHWEDTFKPNMMVCIKHLEECYSYNTIVRPFLITSNDELND